MSEGRFGRRDQLDDDALEARKRGLHYGDYMAMKGAPSRGPRPPAPKGRCWICGTPLDGKQVKDCSARCRNESKKRSRGG